MNLQLHNFHLFLTVSRSTRGNYQLARMELTLTMSQEDMAQYWKAFGTRLAHINIMRPIYVEEFHPLKPIDNMHNESREQYVKAIFYMLESMLCKVCRTAESMLGEVTWRDMEGINEKSGGPSSQPQK